MDPKGKVTIVTGAGSGLGLAACKVLAEAGARVYGFERDTSRLRDIECAASVPIAGVAVDVSNETSVRSAIDEVFAKAGAVHIAVNCAGILKAAKTLSKGGVFPLTEWNEVIAVNLTGTFNVVRFA